MPKRRTWASVTDTPCTCRFFERAANDPLLPIVFDARTSEYHLTYGQLESGESSILILYHCPFCGGAAPDSKRHLLFATIAPEEEHRLARLLGPVRTIRRALRRLGKPERDERGSVQLRQGESQGQPPSVEYGRTLVFESLSKTADIWITERRDGTVAWRLQGKYIGDRSAE